MRMCDDAIELDQYGSYRACQATSKFLETHILVPICLLGGGSAVERDVSRSFVEDVVLRSLKQALLVQIQAAKESKEVLEQVRLSWREWIPCFAIFCSALTHDWPHRCIARSVKATAICTWRR